MDKQTAKQQRRGRRKIRIRRVVEGTTARPRMSVYRSLNHIYVQIIDDLKGRTLVSASSLETELGVPKTGNAQAAAAVGAKVAERAKAAGLSDVVFDRNGFRYHGRVKALADAARKGGLNF